MLNNLLFKVTRVSGNRKTGPIPVSMSQRATCAPSCPFMGKACYAESWPLALHWNRLDKGEGKTLTWSEFLDNVKALPSRTLWRHNQAGDLPHVAGRILAGALRQLAEASVHRGKRGFTYTHHDWTDEANADAVRKANAVGFTVNVSANRADEVDAIMDAGLPAVCVLPADHDAKVTRTAKGRRIVTCPATYRSHKQPMGSCSSCELCAKPDRDFAIGFPAHGNNKRKATAIAEGA